MFDRYKVKNGEDLLLIAKKFNTTPDFIKDINDIYFVENLRAGMDIVVPKNRETYFEIYKIEQGDTLYKIARDYNVNPDLLANMNGLDINDYIYPNQELLIPKTNYSYYITSEGDTLNTVTKTFDISKERLLDQNQTIYLLPGQIIVNKKLK